MTKYTIKYAFASLDELATPTHCTNFDNKLYTSSIDSNEGSLEFTDMPAICECKPRLKYHNITGDLRLALTEGRLKDYRKDILPKLNMQFLKNRQTLSMAGLYKLKNPTTKEVELYAFAAGDAKVFQYDIGNGRMTELTPEGKPLGTDEACPQMHIVPIGIQWAKFLTRIRILICSKEVWGSLGKDGIERIFKENADRHNPDNTVVFKLPEHLSQTFVDAAHEAGAKDACAYIAEVWGEEVVQHERRERCWNTDCDEWSRCNGRGCPGGNWHDI